MIANPSRFGIPSRSCGRHLLVVWGYTRDNRQDLPCMPSMLHNKRTSTDTCFFLTFSELSAPRFKSAAVLAN